MYGFRLKLTSSLECYGAFQVESSSLSLESDPWWTVMTRIGKHIEFPIRHAV